MSTQEHPGPVVIGMDPHKRSVTIEVMTPLEEVLPGGGRYEMNPQDLIRLQSDMARYPQRTWAIEGSRGAGLVIATHLVTVGEQVLDVPAKLAARIRALGTGQGRKTDAADAHSIALVGVRSSLHQVRFEADREVLRVKADARDRAVSHRTRTLNQLHNLLTRLVPSGAGKDLTAPKAARVLAGVRPGTDPLARALKEEAQALLVEVRRLDTRIKGYDKELANLVAQTPTTLPTLPGIAAVGAARLLADVGDLTRFDNRNHFASWTGTAPIDVSSGDVNHHRLSRKGNRQANRVIHTMARTQLRMNHPPAREYYDRKRATKGHKGAMRCLKRRLSDQIYKTMLEDYLTNLAPPGDGPEPGHQGNDTDSSAAGSQPQHRLLRKSLTPDPSHHHPKTPQPTTT